MLNFAKKGLRTLVVGRKYLSPETAKLFANEAYNISLLTEGKETAENVFFTKVERDLEMLGITAIEDRLQEGVPEAIEKILSADIKMWVLTGDKKETAQEIGKLSRLVKESMSCVDMCFEDKNIAQIKTFLTEHESSDLSNSYLIVDGSTLTIIFSDPYVSRAFFNFGLLAKSVICCRVSPKQKSKIVSLAKQHAKSICVAIGDGANDVPMLMEASIGVGIRGKEGTQAVMNSDYAIGQFRFLNNLMFVHGRWGYRRLSGFVCYYFYKNIITIVTQFLFSFYTGYSGQLFFPDVLPLAYNAIFSSWPCTFCFCFEKDVPYETSLAYPILFKAGPKKVFLNIKVFWKWIVFATIHGSLIFYGVQIVKK